MPIIERIHIAGLTNLTEGRVYNEHITFCYYKSATLDTLISRLSTLNRILPLNLEPMFDRKMRTFTAFNGDTILTPQTNYNRHNEPYSKLFKPSSIAHITFAKNPPAGWQSIDTKDLNWDEGLLLDQAYAGFKHDGKMQYFNWEQLSLWQATGKLMTGEEFDRLNAVSNGKVPF